MWFATDQIRKIALFRRVYIEYQAVVLVAIDVPY
jgi:hypothetical protein